MFQGFSKEDFNMEDEELIPYVRSYLEERNKFLGRSPDNVTEQEVEILYWQTRMCRIVSTDAKINNSNTFLHIELLSLADAFDCNDKKKEDLRNEI